MRTIADEYELPEDDDDDGFGYRLRRPRRRIGKWLILLAFCLIVGGGIYSVARVTREQASDSFCLGCHTAPERAYYDRAGSAVAGALAVDLASFHYQWLRGQGENIHCIDCHQGTGSPAHRFDMLTLSVRNSLTWLVGENDTTVEKLRVSVPHLSNDGCLACHQKTLLVAGMANHYHNMLPVVYDLWRNGASVIPPPGTVDKQAVIAAGLVKYDTGLLCSSCHETHRTIEADMYLDTKIVVPERCVQCHREVGKGSLSVSFPQQ
ncbi:MAG: hypothetical protein M1434_12065 [Chloroflexi bacterium]|nr:hypothetical protein [Chloroflexota bacterium]MCL5275458.1 hypothetical protein [Chloroflexota bacterium]